MNEISLKAYAKINIGLDISARRDDGYHELSTLMQSVDLADYITVRKLKKSSVCTEGYVSGNNVRVSDSQSGIETSGNIYIVSDDEGIPKDCKNIAYKAARLMLDEAKRTQKGTCFNDDLSAIDIEIEIKKNIPVQAGMGGGSADAAAVLAGMRELFKIQIDDIKLQKYALSLGADVPYCLTGGTVLCSGIGEVITKLPDLVGCGFVIIKPFKGMSTGEIFNEFDKSEANGLKTVLRPDIYKLKAAVIQHDLDAVSKQAVNVLESIVAKRLPEIKTIKKALYDEGAMAASMTGSGSAVYGIFKDMDTAVSSAGRLKKTFFLNTDVRIISAGNINKGWEVYRHG